MFVTLLIIKIGHCPSIMLMRASLWRPSLGECSHIMFFLVWSRFLKRRYYEIHY